MVDPPVAMGMRPLCAFLYFVRLGTSDLWRTWSEVEGEKREVEEVEARGAAHGLAEATDRREKDVRSEVERLNKAAIAVGE